MCAAIAAGARVAALTDPVRAFPFMTGQIEDRWGNDPLMTVLL
jgi:hypothetical protein